MLGRPHRVMRHERLDISNSVYRPDYLYVHHFDVEHMN